MKTLSRCVAASLTTLAVSAGITASTPEAQAYKAVYAETFLQWGGTRCIVVASASTYNQYTLVISPICSPNGTWRFSETAQSGMFIGDDPDMGDASWLSCQIFVNGVLAESNYARAGDGNEVNCIRTVNY